MIRTGWQLIPAVLLIAVVMLQGCGGLRYSDDPKAASVQALTDFCIGYGALRDVATDLLEVDTMRTKPLLGKDLVEGYAQARAFIRPYCAPDFDPQSEPFSLENLREQLKKIRLLLLQGEQT